MQYSHKIKICVVGSGVVGQATGRGLTKKGFDVTFIDINKDIVGKLARMGYQAYLPEDFINGDWNFDVSMVSVPTPTVNKSINLKYLKEAVTQIGKRLRNLRDYHLVVVRSTVLPGTTENLVIPILERTSGKRVGRDFGVCMNPEFLRAKSALPDFSHPRLTLIGQFDKTSGDVLAGIYQVFNKPIYRISLCEAEFQKYAHNLYNAAKISFFNEMRAVGKGLGINPEKVFSFVAQSAEGMWNPAYGTADFGPYGGVCLPKDTMAFLTWGKAMGYRLPHLAATIEVNDNLLRTISNQKELSANANLSRVS